MKALPRFFYLVAFVGMAASGAVALDRALQPSMTTILLRAVVVAGILGAAGLVHRKAWGVSLVLLPVGAYVLFRTILPPAAGVEGTRGIYWFYVHTLATGAEQYASKFFPLNLAGAPELRLLLATMVYCLTGVASFFALSLRRPVPGVALVMLLVGFSFTVDSIPRVLVSAVLFLVLAACTLVLSRSLERRTWRLRDAIPGVLVGGAGAVLAVLLLGAVPSAAATPWEDWRSWNPFNQGGQVYSFNWLENYPELLNPANNQTILRVQSSEPSYWRANALNEFTGNAWISAQGFQQNLQRTQQATGYVFSIPAADPTPTGQTVTERFQVRSVYTNYLFTGGDPRSLTLGQDAVVRIDDMRSLSVVGALGPTVDYTLRAVIPKVTPSSLVGLGHDYPQNIDRYLELPFPSASQIKGKDKDAAWREAMSQDSPDGKEWVGLYSLSQSIVGDATDPYDIALRLERYLRQNYRYTLQPPASDYTSPYAAFLFDTKAGYCQHFAGAMALLLRFNGIPARVAVGFTSGNRESTDVYSVSTNDAHAWVEAYFPSVGWVAFDPTPGYNLPYPGASSTSPGFTNPFAASPSGSTTPTTEASPDRFPDRSPDSGATTPSTGTGWFSRLAWLPWAFGLVAALVAWPVARKLWQERGLHHGALTQRFAASLRLLRGALAGYGIAATGSSTFEELLSFIEDHLGLTCDPLLAARAGAVLFGGRKARAEDLSRAENFRREVHMALRRRYGWLRTVRNWYWAPPGRRRGTRREVRRGVPAQSAARAVHERPGVRTTL